VTVEGTGASTIGPFTAGVYLSSVSGNAVTFNVADVTSDTNADLIVSATLKSGGSGLTKAGAGTMRLDAADTYTGDTTINAGTLVLGSSGSIGSSAAIYVGAGALFDVSGVSGGYTVNNGQTLQGDGTVTGDVSVASGGTLAPGASVGAGTLTIQGNVTLDGGATNLFNLTSDHAVGGNTNDLLVIDGDVSLGGSHVTIRELDVLTSGTYVLMRYTGSRTGTCTLDITGTWRLAYALNYDDANREVELVVTGSPNNLEWNPLASGAWIFTDQKRKNQPTSTQDVFKNSERVPVAG
jgi:fibronectin-binding autotransporter adhesin